MNNFLKFLINTQLKRKHSQSKKDASGFTLIELLVGLVLAFLVITPLLGFMINILDTDRREQAKATTEQEIQAALDYIARDMDQAFFIYDGLGLSKIEANLPDRDGGEPVLVFWKRQFLQDALPIKGAGAGDCQPNNPDPNNCDDTFVYSLVAYYLVKDPTGCENSTWSCAARIERVQVKDEVLDVNNGNGQGVVREADVGFVPFDLEGDSVENSLNEWPANNGTPSYGGDTKFETVIDYVDQTATNPPSCSTEARPTDAPLPAEVPEGSSSYPYRLVGTSEGLYACVDAYKPIAQVYIRGNALARLRQKDNVPTFNQSQLGFFPRSSIQVEGGGLLNQNPSSP